ncbi:hypothetical protein QBC33DRAFT_61515 [Phialemonium atrogriseum]|uniref:Cyclin-D1-binding protein 1-like N-terminal domain-containing protein n=1 Tax=Phialemonium atrogriseum TaxID=1093897 RepID=A0AAJ0C0Y0_9PEZI|nr:uncharacterized protein QBC33DRAFT_61515 [Phialemonium atrogriseum]KAK1767881.1 hypothetical protein QBC33DRAFT_61515 [Phialemonium atrogriseum]
MAGSSSTNSSLVELGSVVHSTIALVTELETVIGTITARGQAEKPAGETTLDALSLAHDSASLIKAHATKISLLIINEPFTPTAITKVLRELIAGPLPALASAAEACDANRYTQAVRRDLSWRCGRVLKEYKELVQRIPSDGKILSDAKKNGSRGVAAEKGSIPVTGLLWAACDEVIALSKLGVAGYFIQKVKQFRDMVKDTMEELKEWGEEEDEDEEEGETDTHGDEPGDIEQVTDSLEATHISDTQAMLDEFMGSQRPIPRDDPDRIREKLDIGLRRLRLITLFYQAIIKRRLQTLPPLPPPSASDVPSKLDEAITFLGAIPERFESLAVAFYELEPGDIDAEMDECFSNAFSAAELLRRSWTGENDGFTDWVLNFQLEMKKA